VLFQFAMLVYQRVSFGTWIVMSLGSAKPDDLLKTSSVYIIEWSFSMVYAWFIGLLAGLRGSKLRAKFEQSTWFFGAKNIKISLDCHIFLAQLNHENQDPQQALISGQDANTKRWRIAMTTLRVNSATPCSSRNLTRYKTSVEAIHK
jgi:hypothetical protein